MAKEGQILPSLLQEAAEASDPPKESGWFPNAPQRTETETGGLFGYKFV